MYKTSMKLTEEEREILEGKRGDALRKALESIVRYGEIFGATELVKLDHEVHLVTSFGIPLLKPVFDIMDELIEAGLKTDKPFTVDPRPCDFANVPTNFIERLVFTKIMYAKQKDYEAQLTKVGLKDDKSFSCACYFDEVGNIPKQGENLAWAESSAVVYANSVLGARTNRNSGVLELLCGIVGRGAALRPAHPGGTPRFLGGRAQDQPPPRGAAPGQRHRAEGDRGRALHQGPGRDARREASTRPRRTTSRTWEPPPPPTARWASTTSRA